VRATTAPPMPYRRTWHTDGCWAEVLPQVRSPAQAPGRGTRSPHVRRPALDPMRLARVQGLGLDRTGTDLHRSPTSPPTAPRTSAARRPRSSCPGTPRRRQRLGLRLQRSPHSPSAAPVRSPHHRRAAMAFSSVSVVATASRCAGPPGPAGRCRLVRTTHCRWSPRGACDRCGASTERADRLGVVALAGAGPPARCHRGRPPPAGAARLPVAMLF